MTYAILTAALLLGLMQPRIEHVGIDREAAWFQVAIPDRHFDASFNAKYQVILWAYWKGEDDSGTYGNEQNDGTIIAYGYWPDCRWNSVPRSATPVPYCGWKQASGEQPY